MTTTFVDVCAGCWKPDTRGHLFPAPANTPDPCTCWKACYWSPSPTGMYADVRGGCRLERGHAGRHDWQDADESARERVVADGLGYRSIEYQADKDTEPTYVDHLHAARDAERQRYADTVSLYQRGTIR